MTPTQQQWDEAFDELFYQIDRQEAVIHSILAELELEQADKQRELVFDFNKTIEQEAKESA